MESKDVQKIVEILYKMYPEAKCALNFNTPYELLISTILSAQCTDKRVNVVTKELFKEYNTPLKMLTLTEEELQQKIKSCGLYKNKSKNILEASRGLIDKFKGEVPRSLEELTSLAGVGRKTANVVMSNAFGIPAIAVDTHVFRVSNRIGIADSKNVYDTEKQLMKNIKKEDWSTMHHALIWHGRQLCKARKPECESCGLKENCKYFKEHRE
ncbi:endonuclease III [Clostridium felsineum]|uniref:endonuclease III n=1 Tax=Clostridium felsineum TaxID=36839 RepID=UPI00098BD9CF|nr:endonuclease III [Clostridium felsineum]MCR3758845.1 endonuclease III [Clostridium felsineum]